MGLGDRLRTRKPLTETVRLPLDPTQYGQAERELETATLALEDARSRGVTDLSRLQEDAAAARVQLDACECELVTLRALPPADWEALVGLHPATEEQRARGATWNTATFRAALLAASTVPGEGEAPLTEADWEVLAKDGSLTLGELNTLFNTAVDLNTRAPARAVGNG